jgi:hypothetical protein
LLQLLLFNPSHSNIFADHENNLPINPLFFRKDIFRGIPPPPPLPIATALYWDNFNEKKSILYIFVGKRIFIIKVAGYDIIRSLLTIFVATENKGEQ